MSILSPPPLWIPQQRAIEQTREALLDGHRRVLLTLPTGAGKTRIACEMIRDWLVCGLRVSLYTNRRMLLDQLSGVLSRFGLDHGIRAAGSVAHGSLPTGSALQVSSIQTEASRTIRKKAWQLHDADRILVDEAHLQKGQTAREIFQRHLERPGSAIVGLTATPLDLGGMYDHLIVGARNSDLRQCGALVAASHYGPDEPDTSSIKKEQWEYTEQDVRKVMRCQAVFGRVLEWFGKLNPNHRPTLLFAPGVPESIWFSDQFRAAGIESAHIDGKTCCYKGRHYDSDREIRDEILAAWRSGEIKILCNRFVLREGIDAPFVEHLILATIFGSLQSYLQSVGRGLRASPQTGKKQCTIQDHGGNWWRHGSANADRHWELGDTESVVQGLRQEKLRNQKQNPDGEREPLRCPQCAKILTSRRCGCGYEIKQKTRPVIQADGTLKEHGGDIFRPRFTKQEPNTQELWEKMYYRSRDYKQGRTFRQAVGLFYYENRYFPPRTLRLMPKYERDMFRLVRDVPRSDLL